MEQPGIEVAGHVRVRRPQRPHDASSPCRTARRFPIEKEGDRRGLNKNFVDEKMLAVCRRTVLSS